MNVFRLVMLVMYHCAKLLANCEIQDKSLVAFNEYVLRNVNSLADKEVKLKVSSHLLYVITDEARQILLHTMRLTREVNNLRSKNHERRVNFMEEVTDLEVASATE